MMNLVQEIKVSQWGNSKAIRLPLSSQSTVLIWSQTLKRQRRTLDSGIFR
jgi:hypothetical protein